MNGIVDKRKLFCDENRAIALLEFKYEVKLLRKIIELAEKGVMTKEVKETGTYEGICYLFASSIISYCKMAYDNIVIGHFYAAHMVLRSIIENNVCLDVIQTYKKEELWKYYVVHSYKKTLASFGNDLTDKEKSFLDKIVENYKIDKDFLEKGEKKKAYIDVDYGWIYKIKKHFSFFDLCQLVNQSEYKDFKIMSTYSHGTSVYLKHGGFMSIEYIMNLISCLYINIYRVIAMYCDEEVQDEFYTLCEEMESIIFNFIDVHSFE